MTARRCKHRKITSASGDAEAALPVEGNTGQALLPDKRLRIFCDAFQQFDVSPVAGLRRFAWER
jgi:hypothetical protein